MSKKIELGDNLAYVLVMIAVFTAIIISGIYDSKENESTEKEMVITKTITDGVESVDTTYITKTK